MVDTNRIFVTYLFKGRLIDAGAKCFADLRSWAKAIVEHLSNELKSASSDKEVVEGSINHGINASESLQYLNELTRSQEDGFAYIPRVDNSIPGHTPSAQYSSSLPSWLCQASLFRSHQTG